MKLNIMLQVYSIHYFLFLISKIVIETIIILEVLRTKNVKLFGNVYYEEGLKGYH
jgi:hypothetical protein